MRDVQKRRIYAAEQTCSAWHRRPFQTMVEVWSYLERIERDRWFRRHYGVKRFRVLDAPHAKRGSALAGCYLILPKFARHPQYILHEIAHCVSPAGEQHGRAYAATYLRLVRHFLGELAFQELRAAFKQRCVRYTPKRQLSDATRATLTERLAHMRAAGQMLT